MEVALLTHLPYITLSERVFPMYYINSALDRNKLVVFGDSNKSFILIVFVEETISQILRK